MELEITVYGTKFDDENEKFSLDFILTGDHSLDDLSNDEYFGCLISHEISERLNFHYKILDFDIFAHYSMVTINEKL